MADGAFVWQVLLSFCWVSVMVPTMDYLQGLNMDFTAEGLRFILSFFIAFITGFGIATFWKWLKFARG